MIAQFPSKVKESKKFPGLTYELRKTANGFSVEFTNGCAFEAYELVNGRAVWVDCSDRDVMPAPMLAHCRETARALAAKLTTARKAA